MGVKIKKLFDYSHRVREELKRSLCINGVMNEQLEAVERKCSLTGHKYISHPDYKIIVRRFFSCSMI